MRFLVDMALSPDVAIWLRSQDHDAIHASELSLNRAPDVEILSTAATQERILVTADLDFSRLISGLRTISPGLILLRGGNIRRVLMRYRLPT